MVLRLIDDVVVNPFNSCPICCTVKSIMIKHNEFECGRCASTLSFEEYNIKPINGIVMAIK